MMMRNGVTFPVLAEVLRRLFVEVAVADILTQPKARTDSRISLLTGIHRKEIRRFREMPPDGAAAPETVTLASQVIARWLGSAPFLDDTGQPRPLPRSSEAGVAEPSFDALVGSVTTDIRPRAVLDDWLSLGLVSLTPTGSVVLNADAFIPRPGGEEQLFYFARNLHDHVAAAVANVTADGTAPFLDRSVHYDELTPGQVRALEAFARTAAVQVLLDVNRKALDLIEDGELPAGGQPITGDTVPDGQPLQRLNFGVFIFSESCAPTHNQLSHADGAAE
jgi:hypothetical protein